MRMILSLMLAAALLLSSCAGPATQPPPTGQPESVAAPISEQAVPTDPPPILPAPTAGVIRSGSR